MPQSRPPALVIFAARYLVPRTFLLARGARALSAVDLDGGGPVLLVPLLRSACPSPAEGAVECWNRHAPGSSPRALAVVHEGSAAFLVAEATLPTAPLRVRSPGERTRLCAEAAAIGGALDAAGLTLPDPSLVDLVLVGDALCLARPAVPRTEAGPSLASLLPLLIPEPVADLVAPDRTRPARTPPGRVRRRVRPLTLAAAVAASAAGYAVVGAALPQRGGVDPAIASRPGPTSTASPRQGAPSTVTPVAAAPLPPSARPAAARGGPARPVDTPRRARARADRRPPPPAAARPAAAVTRADQAPSASSQGARANVPAAVEQVPAAPAPLPLAPMIPARA